MQYVILFHIYRNRPLTFYFVFFGKDGTALENT